MIRIEVVDRLNGPQAYIQATTMAAARRVVESCVTEKGGFVIPRDIRTHGERTIHAICCSHSDEIRSLITSVLEKLTSCTEIDLHAYETSVRYVAAEKQSELCDADTEVRVDAVEQWIEKVLTRAEEPCRPSNSLS